MDIQRKIAGEKVRLEQLKEESNAAQPVSVSGYEEQRQVCVAVSYCGIVRD